uniref:Uncharacterized protein n=1 Tax=Leersia perrieri TaxID=77586 RepID=A0A0D9XXV6_9ORYZ
MPWPCGGRNAEPAHGQAGSSGLRTARKAAWGTGWWWQPGGRAGGRGTGWQRCTEAMDLVLC